MSVENSDNVLLAGEQTVEVEDWTRDEQFITDGRVGEANPELTKFMEVMLWAASPAEDPPPAPSPHALQALEETGTAAEGSVSVFDAPRRRRHTPREGNLPRPESGGPPDSEGVMFPPALDLAGLDEESYIGRIQEISRYVQELTLQFGFNDRTIPPCWASHLSLVALLSGLYGSYKCCFAPVSQGEQVITYIRNLETARVCLERLVQNSSCATGEHKPWQLNYWAGEQLANTDKAWWAKYL